MQLQTDPEIVLHFSSPTQIKGTLKLSNVSPHSSLIFKLKTTNPNLFQVNPNKGFLNSGRSKEIEIGIVGSTTARELMDITMRQKFLIEFILVSDGLRHNDIEDEWKKQVSEQRHKKLKLKIRAEGIVNYLSNANINIDQGERRGAEAVNRRPHTEIIEVRPQEEIRFNRPEPQPPLGRSSNNIRPEREQEFAGPNAQRQKLDARIKEEQGRNNGGTVRLVVVIIVLLLALSGVYSMFFKSEEQSIIIARPVVRQEENQEKEKGQDEV